MKKRGLARAALITGMGAMGVTAAAAHFLKFAIRRRGQTPTPYLDEIRRGEAWIDQAQAEDVFITSHDGLRLHGRFYPAEKATGNAILAFHGYRGSARNNFAGLTPFYHSLGWNVLLIDQRAHGESEGIYIGMGCLERHDCRRWAYFLADRLMKTPGCEDARIFLHGISMGGATVLMACSSDLPDAVRGVIADCGYTSAWDIFRLRLQKDYRLPAFPILHAADLLCRKTAGYRFGECSALDTVRYSRLPVCFIHGGEDDFVPTGMTRRLYAACSSEKELLIVPGAGHAVAYYAGTAAYQKTLAAFLSRFASSSRPLDKTPDLREV